MAEGVFWLSLALLFHTFAGYPLLMALWAHIAPCPVRRATSDRSVAVIVVAYNEAARIEAKIETLLAQDYPADRLRVVVACDGSTDATAAIVRSYADQRVSLLSFPQRRGKAACLNDAVASCDEDIIVFNDSRQKLNPQAVRCLAENFADPHVGAVSGELVFVSEGMTDFGGGVDAYWRYEKFIRQCEARVHSVPGATGALYAIRRECFGPIPAGTILDDVAIPMQAAMAGYRVVFDGRAQAFDHASLSAAQEKLRKVRTLAGNYQLLALMPRLLLPVVNPIWAQFMSHKVLRLLAPFAMLSLLLANAALAASPPFAIFLASQLALYILAIAGALIPAIGRLKLARIATAFLMLNWFAVLGLLQFLSQRDAHLWTSGPAPATPVTSATHATPTRRD